MRSFWKFAAPVLCVAVIFGVAIAWRHREARASQAKPGEDISAVRQRAEQGDAAAQADLAHLYSQGLGVQRDYAEALRWYRRSADQGNAKGQDGVGTIYYYGRGVPPDYNEALRWHRSSADQGYAPAEYNLGFMYSHGQGVQQDFSEAIRWYRKAADQGYAPAEYNLGNMYYYGRGVPWDRAEADRWYQKAADQGDEYAQRALGLRSRLKSGSAVLLWIMFLSSMLALKDALLPRANARHPQPRAFTIGGIIGLAYVGLSICQYFIVFKTVPTLSAFRFVTALMAGVTLAMYVTVIGRKAAKVAMGISGALLTFIDFVVIWAIWHHKVTQPVMTIPGFGVVNGLLIGIVGTLAIFLRLQMDKTSKGKRAVAGFPPS